MKAIRQALKNKRSGFTLIELLVVVVIIALLMAIAIPAYLSQQKKAKDSQAKQYLVTAYKEARSGALENNNLFPSSASLVATIASSEPGMSFLQSADQSGATKTNKVYLDNSGADQVGGSNLLLYAKSGSGTTWRLKATPSNQMQITTASYDAVVLGNSPVGYWRLDGGSAADSSSSALNGSWDGTPSSTPGAFPGDTATLFGGWPTRMNLGTPAKLKITGPFTLEAWFKKSVGAGPAGTTQVIYQWNNYGVLMDFESNDPHLYVQYSDISTAHSLTSTASLEDGAWHYAVFSFDGSREYLYIDGVLDKSAAATGTPYYEDVNASIGASGYNGYNFYGAIDEVAIYNSALSAADIRSHFDLAR